MHLDRRAVTVPRWIALTRVDGSSPAWHLVCARCGAAATSIGRRSEELALAELERHRRCGVIRLLAARALGDADGRVGTGTPPPARATPRAAGGARARPTSPGI